MDNKEIVRRVATEPWTGNFDVVDELVAEDYVGYDPAMPEPTRGREGVKQFYSEFLAAYPDASLTIEHQIAEGDYVATRWTGRGTQKGDLMGIPATGKQVTVSGITVSRLKGGKIAEEWITWDTLGMMQQLGAIPAPTTA